VEVESGGEKFTVEGDQITLSAGAIGSPHILLLSGVGPAEQLKSIGIPLVHDLPGVGKNLRDHPLIYATFRTKKGHELDNFGPRIQMALRFTAEGSDLRNDMQLLMSSYATERMNRGGPRGEALGVRILAILNLAMGVGELTLTTADPTVQPFLDYRYLEDEFDRRRLREAVRLCVKLGQFEGFSDIIEECIEPTEAELATDETLDEFLMREVSTAQHISCTCKMGAATDPMAVVDQYGRVHGLEGLRVADASIMPNCVRANTNVTTMVIGERVSDFIRQGA
jgi:choline dehydrogenase